MTRYFGLGIGSVLVLVLVNCGPAVMRGTLVGKYQEPKSSWTQMIPVYTGNATAVIPIVHDDDEDWVFVVEDSPLSGTKPSQRKISVSQQVFSRYREGDWIEIADLGEIKDREQPTKSRKPDETKPK